MLNRNTQQAVLFLSIALLAGPVIAAGGLAAATTAVKTFQAWLYGFTGVGAIVYMIYQIGMAMLDKQPWGDVLVGIGKVALAGGAVVLATWAWGIWGS